MRNFLQRLSLALAATIAVFALSGSLQAQNPGNAQQPAATAQQPNDMPAQDAKAFTGTIVKDGKKLVLKDTASNMSYALDDQDKAKQFEGKQVKVTGTLDLNRNVIHVTNIELLAS